ncbi:glycine--tRNA ligase subunit beta [Fredinandcohnia quinoae]|uniref:Glycine--tRNA ligase beta subunit n=1 Tax=Fredinandcohnia quinoae TaxID=2918902 RepID=A0AAW5DX89_9BACI|nr:glycine--tRNA ligase subunit beta [Fredinandcohnia sp. SECRCQ15]MCH1624968.1 glycine--tRNA ligase subunit beta [Fredinandcohnia sp. SECRCQ15]
MNKRDLLVEIGLEEMPARFVTDAMNQLTDKMTKWLLDKNISYETINGFSSPRRLAVLVTDVSEKQDDVEIEAKGPAKKIALDSEGNWSKAAIGFTKGQGATVTDIYFKEINGVEYAHVTKFVKGLETKESLKELEEVITNLTFPKNMHWGDNDLRFVRPIKWLVTLFGDDIIPISISGVESGNKTRGHRFLGSEILLLSPKEYERQLMSQYVIVDSLERKEAIRNQIKTLEEENNWVVPIDRDLLEEVTNLVEYPTAFYGKFEEEFLELPEEVLITSMKEHQRYFPVKDKEGKLQPFFVAVRNGDHVHLDTVARGNEKVLRARLSDADFFYKEDQKLKINDLVNKLDKIIYQVELGSIGEKVRRIGELTNQLSILLSVDEQIAEKAKRAADICKFDLVTNMVYEFPELQGLMGERYARLSGEDEAVAIAINEHYMPRHAEDKSPSTMIGTIISIADKLDTIVGCFSIGIIPTGSQDPYALRRMAAGIVQILLEKEWNIPLEDLLDTSLELFEESKLTKRTKQEIKEDLVSFFKLRIKHDLQTRNIRYDIIDAVLGTEIGNIGLLVKKAETLESRKDDAGFKETIESLSRVINISKKGEEAEIDPALFESKEEKNLYEKVNQIQSELIDAIKEVQVDKVFESLASLKPEIDAYFEHTMVMAEDESIKKNRLAQMVLLANMIYLFADMNSIIVK